MRRLPKTILAVVAVAGIAFMALLGVILLTGDWAMFLLGATSFASVVLLLVVIRGQWQHRGSMKALSERLDKTAAHVDGLVSRPALLSGSQDQLIAEMAARFDWIARRQAEVVRLLKDLDLDNDDNDVDASPGQGSAVDR
jgi:hypothetical protein